MVENVLELYTHYLRILSFSSGNLTERKGLCNETKSVGVKKETISCDRFGLLRKKNSQNFMESYGVL
jgi:hypothetical protein